MTDPLSWSFSLGRWGGTMVRVHVLFLLFVAGKLLGALTTGQPILDTLAWLAMLVVALAVHELGHAAMAASQGVEIEEIRLWPLGNFTPPSPPGSSRGIEPIWVALAGPALSGVCALVMAIGLNFSNAQFVWNPFAASGAPYLRSGDPATSLTAIWYIGWFGYLNWLLFLMNLIPALPMDGGRVLRAAWRDYSRDGLVPAWTARASAIILFLVGVIRLLFYAKNGEQGFTLIGLAVLIELVVRAEARMIEDGGFFDDGVFGYDFSQGYTSLESSTPKVRPHRESALKRWRRRRSDLRRQRRLEQEAAEERRMDEILAKLHQEGRGALSDEEQRFLVRVSLKFKSRIKARG